MVAPTAASAVTSTLSKRDAAETSVNLFALLQEIALAAFNVACCLVARFYSGFTGSADESVERPRADKRINCSDLISLLMKERWKKSPLFSWSRLQCCSA